MISRFSGFCTIALVALGLAASPAIESAAEGLKPAPAAAVNGIVRVKSAYGMAETIARIKADIAAKGITFFLEVDQSKLAGGANINLRPSTLLIFGNPGLGTHFMTAKAESGIDWPVRLLVIQDAQGQVWAVYTDFAWIAARHGITTRDKEFAMASAVIASITSSVAAK
jgi:uncharacterized protein (DUF302 family)